MSLEQLVYISTSNIALDTPMAVADILEVSSRNNGLYRITGALTYSGSHFVQLLEGPSDALDWLVDRLRFDPRHRDLEVLDRIAIHERAFPEWSMLFPSQTPVNLAALAKLIAERRRHAPVYRDVLLKMSREMRRSIGGY